MTDNDEISVIFLDRCNRLRLASIYGLLISSRLHRARSLSKFWPFQGLHEKGCLPSTKKKADVDIDHPALFYWSMSRALFMVKTAVFLTIHLVIKIAVDVDSCTFLGRHQQSCFFLPGRRRPLPFSTWSTSILQPFSSHPFSDFSAFLCLNFLQR